MIVEDDAKRSAQFKDAMSRVQAIAGRVAIPAEPGKDEFGRDLPTATAKPDEKKDAGDGAEEEDMALDDSDDEAGPGSSSKQGPATASNPAPAPMRPFLDRASDSSGGGSRADNRPTAPVTPTTPFSQTGSFQPQTPRSAGLTLDTFDRSSFNPGDPMAWASLGEAWKASTGRDPSQLELMQWLAGMTPDAMGGMGGGAATGGMGSMAEGSMGGMGDNGYQGRNMGRGGF